MNNRILSIIVGGGADIEFPSHQGKHGTCDFMTPLCSLACKQTTNDFRINVVNFFKSHNEYEIVTKILKDMKEMGSYHLLWFTYSGDCPIAMTTKISTLITLISEEKIPQNGFTRNQILWSKVKDIKDVKFVLTVEDEHQAKEKSKEGLVAVPDYDTDRITIMNNGKIVHSNNVVEKEEYIEERICSSCRVNKKGCWNI